MSLTPVPNVFQNGTTADATAVNANFNAIFKDHNGNITDANIAASGITTYGKVNASAISSLGSLNSGAGVIPIANLATGTPTGSLFVRDDGTLASVTSIDSVAGNGTVGLVNLLEGGDFENWSAGTSVAPDYWTLTGAGAAVIRTSATPTPKIGTYCAGVQRIGADCRLQRIDTSHPINYWKGRTVTLGAWVYATVASRARVLLIDDTAHYSSYHTGDSTWQWLSVTITVSSGASTLTSGLAVDTGNTLAYFDGAMLTEGASKFAFTPHPNDQHKVYIGAATRDTSAASGRVAYTGIGFTPKYIHFFGGYDSTDDNYTGFATAGTQTCSFSKYGTGILGTVNTACIYLITTVGVSQLGSLYSMDADGFSIDWTKTGSPTGLMDIRFIAHG